VIQTHRNWKSFCKLIFCHVQVKVNSDCLSSLCKIANQIIDFFFCHLPIMTWSVAAASRFFEKETEKWY